MNIAASQKIHNFILLSLTATVFFTYHYFFHSGFFGYDELEYTKLASILLRGNWEHNLNLYSYRWGVVIPLASLYKVFGIGDFANVLFSSIILVGVVSIVLRCLKNYTFLEKSLAVSFLCLLPIHLMYLVKPMPDIVVELGFAFCFLAYLNLFNKGRPIFAALIFSIGAVFCFIAKETFVLFYPFFLFFFVKDLYQKKNLIFWKWVVINLLLFLFLYFGFFQIAEGQAFIRVKALFHNRFQSDCSYHLQPTIELLKRLGYELWLCFTRFQYLIPLAFTPLLKEKYQLKPWEKFTIKSLVFLLLISNFMTISYVHYIPLCDDPRHYIFILPIAAIVMAIGLKKVKQLDLTDRIIATCIILIQLIISYYFSFENHIWLFLPILIGITFAKFLPKTAVATLIILGLLSSSIQNAKYNLSVNYSDQKKLIEYVITGDKSAQIISDAANISITDYCAKYDTSYSYIEYEDWSISNINPSIPSYIISNGMTAYLSNVKWDKVDTLLHHPDRHFEKVYSNKAGEVYKISNL